MNLIPRKRDQYWFDPFKEVERIQRDMNSLLGGSLMANLPSRDSSLYDQVFNPAVDLEESDDKYTLKVDLPGVDKKDIELTVEDNSIAIKGEKKEERKDKDKGALRTERFYGRFYREVAFPLGIDNSKITADYTNGVLQITVPKKEETKPKQIKVDIK